MTDLLLSPNTCVLTFRKWQSMAHESNVFDLNSKHWSHSQIKVTDQIPDSLFLLKLYRYFLHIIICVVGKCNKVTQFCQSKQELHIEVLYTCQNVNRILYKNRNVNGILLLQYDDALKGTTVCCKAVRKDCVAQRWWSVVVNAWMLSLVYTERQRSTFYTKD